MASTAEQQQQQQQQPTSFHDITLQPCIVWHIAHHLTRLDAARLALAAPNTARAFQGCLQQLHCCPRIIAVASGSHKLLELPLGHDAQPYRHQHDGQKQNTTAGIIREVAAKPKAKRKRRAVFSTTKRGNTTWLTGAAVGPSSGSICSGQSDHNSVPAQLLYVCDYATRGVLTFATGSLRPLGIFASAPELSAPEGIAWVGSTCYVAAADSSSIVALSLDGTVRQVFGLGEGSLPWGLTAWNPAGQGSACLAALFVAVDVEYVTERYTVPPAAATGGVVCVALDSGGTMLGQPQQYSTAAIKRPSGLCFDRAGHLLVTSMDRLLLRLAGPQQPNPKPGSLLQTVNLQALLPQSVRGFMPFDVQAIPSLQQTLLSARSIQPGAAAREGAGAAMRAASQYTLGAAGQASCAETVLAVTLHRGPRVPGAVAVLQCVDGIQLSASEFQNSSPRPIKDSYDIRGENSGAVEQQAMLDVLLLSMISGHKALKEPNMIAIL